MALTWSRTARGIRQRVWHSRGRARLGVSGNGSGTADPMKATGLTARALLPVRAVCGARIRHSAGGHHAVRRTGRPFSICDGGGGGQEWDGARAAECADAGAGGIGRVAPAAPAARGGGRDLSLLAVGRRSAHPGGRAGPRRPCARVARDRGVTSEDR
jgi:hypothetical protein